MFTFLSKREKRYPLTYECSTIPVRNKKERRFSVNIPKKKKGKKSTGLIFISADLGMLSSGIAGMVLNLLQ